ncbi:MAG TPA: threonine/serine dehydratase [Acetobacteraceae bacterium]|nr:threonine/serine dehydratase [Acetobacteraceae bacterium]
MPTRDEIRAAARRIANRIRRTPILRLRGEELRLSFPVTLKLEQLQVTGSFKPRGAFNRILTAGDVPEAGVIAASGGNHGLAVAHAAKVLNLRAEIFVPEATPQAKRQRIEAAGATLVVGGASYDEARAASETRARETGALVVHAYDQEAVLAGQGTIGLEMSEDAPDLTHVLVAVGGGGLYGGIASWYRDEMEVVPVEPDSCPTLTMAMLMGRPASVPVGGVAADSLGARMIGELALRVARRGDTQVITVSDEAIRAAQRRLWEVARIVAEPGGACAFAALLSGAWTPPPDARVGVVVCGANCDPGMVAT